MTVDDTDGTDDVRASPVPDLIEPVVGFRQWRLGGGELLSIACDERWRGPRLVARCLADGHPQEAAPVSACTCGVYAWYEQCPRTASATRDHVAGAVVLWGAIELHATGMRAQHCRIVALALPMSHGVKRDRVVAVADRFGVPAVRHRDLAPMARRHGVEVARDLRPGPSWPGASVGPYGAIPRRMPGGLGTESWFRRSAPPQGA